MRLRFQNAQHAKDAPADGGLGKGGGKPAVEKIKYKLIRQHQRPQAAFLFRKDDIFHLHE